MSTLTLARPSQRFPLRTTINAIATITGRDIVRVLRDPSQWIGALVVPFLFVGVLGSSFQASFGQGLAYDLQIFVCIGVFVQTLFGDTVERISTLIDDRENDFSQEMFIAPISRYAIVFGKILGAVVVSSIQSVLVLGFGVVAFGLPFDPIRLGATLAVGVAVAGLGGAFGVMLLSLLGGTRGGVQLISLLLFPQFFLAGTFTPIRNMPWYLDIASRLTPMRYAVDLVRGVFYAGKPEYDMIVLLNPALDALIVAVMFVVFLVVGTWLFVRSDRNR